MKKMMRKYNKIKAGCLLALFLAVSFARTGYFMNLHADNTVKPPPVGAVATVESAEIVTGVCTFGDCPVATTVCTTDSAVYDLEKVEEVVVAKNATTEPVTKFDVYDNLQSDYSATYIAHEFCQLGEIYWGGWRWTWYSEKVLPGGGLNIPGRHTSGGYVRDINGYICLASDVLEEGTVIETPFGSPGRVYDCGVGNDYTVDVYVGW